MSIIEHAPAWGKESNRTTEPSPWTARTKLGFAALWLVWLAAAYVIGSEQLLASNQPGLLRPVAVMVVVPVGLFLAAYWALPWVRSLVHAADIRTLTMVQHWRVIGFGFLPLFALGVLPGVFALPAGLGDVALGIGALYVVGRFDRDPDYRTSSGLVRFHVLGLADFALAETAAGLSSGVAPALLFGGPTSAGMEVWPLSIFPTILVPSFIIAHAVVLLKVRHLRRIGTAG